MAAASPSLPALRRAANLSVAVAVLVLVLRLVTYALTHSLAALADAVEPVFNLFAATATRLGVTAGRRPADDTHPFGHRKLEFLAVGFHGTMALVGAAVVLGLAMWQLASGLPIQPTAPAIALFALSVALSAVLSRRLRSVGAEHASPALTAAGHHARLDSYLSVAVLMNLLIAGRPGWAWLDPVASLFVIGWIVHGAVRLLRLAVTGLMDTAEPAVREQIQAVVADRLDAELVGFHDIRARDAGGRIEVDLHLQFAAGTSLERAHALAEEVEAGIEAVLGSSDATAHIEPASEVRADRRPEPTPPSPREQARRRAAGVSAAVAVCLAVIKFLAWGVTGSAAVLSDALESLVNIVAAGFAVFSVRLSRASPDRRHPYGHHKIEFLAAAFEGGLIVIAAILIILAAVPRLSGEVTATSLDLGLLLVLAAASANAALGCYLVRTGRRLASLTLEADGRHVLSDVWTSVGVIAGLAVVRFTGWWPADPLAALAVAVYILLTGIDLLRRSVLGVMDTVDPAMTNSAQTLLDRAVADGRILAWHRLRVRDVGSHRFVDLHIQLPEGTSLADAHEVAESLERELEAELAPADAILHAEPASEVK